MIAIRWICLGLLVAFFSNGDVAFAAGKIVHTTNSADALVCQRQLNIIHGAIEEYQKRNQHLPLWLSDLVPEFIHDANTLVCPFVRNSGILRQWRAWTINVPVFGDPGDCTYGYEFSTQLFWRDLHWTTRNYKEHQMELMGLGVPIVRCLAHVPALNLGFDGSIYNSSGEWEDVFVRSPEQRSVLHNFLFLTNISGNKLAARLCPPRNPDANARGMLDLSTIYNASLLHLSQIDPAGKLLVTYPEGELKIAGIDFDVRGLIHLSAGKYPIAFPGRVENIPVNRTCASIHFLHGVTSLTTNGSKVASFVVRFRDGHTTQRPVIYGTDVKARWFDPRQKSELDSIDSGIGGAKPAWITPPDKLGTTGKSLRLYVSSWTNQQPASEVLSVDFVSELSESAPFLLAITAQ